MTQPTAAAPRALTGIHYISQNYTGPVVKSDFDNMDGGLAFSDLIPGQDHHLREGGTVPDQLLRELKILAEIAQSLGEITDLREVKSLRDRAEAARHNAQIAGLGLNFRNQAAEVMLRAERRAGKLLANLINHGGNRKTRSHVENSKLSELDIDHNQSARWQREASVPDAVFEEHIAVLKKAGKEITARGLLRLAPMPRPKP
jgi:hypothetical protein